MASSDAGNSFTVKGVEIPTTDNGSEYKTLINVINGMAPDFAPGIGDTLSQSMLPITIVGTSEQTARGVRRVLVKVELPYASLQQCNCESGSYNVDTAKSGDPITMHLVLTLPKQAGIDLQSSGTTRDAVFVRIAMLQYILESLVRINPRTVHLPQEPGSSTGTANYHVGLAGGPQYPGALTVVGKSANGEVILDAQSPLLRGASLLKPFLASGEYGVEAPASNA